MWYKNIRAQNLLIFALSSFGIVGSIYVFTMKPEISFEERHQIEKVIFSVLVHEINQHPEATLEYIFLGVSGSDPSPEILEAFADNRLSVKPISSSKITFGFTAPVVHKSDRNKRGVQINLDIVGKEPSGYVKAFTSLYQDRITTASYKYTLAKSDGFYRILSVERPEQVYF